MKRATIMAVAGLLACGCATAPAQPQIERTTTPNGATLELAVVR